MAFGGAPQRHDHLVVSLYAMQLKFSDDKVMQVLIFSPAETLEMETSFVETLG